MNPYLIIAALVGWIATAGGAFLYGEHVADQSAKVAALTKAVDERDATIAQQKADAAASADVLEGFKALVRQKDEKALNDQARVTELETYVAGLPAAPACSPVIPEPTRAPAPADAAPVSRPAEPFRCPLGERDSRLLNAIGLRGPQPPVPPTRP